MNSHSREYPSLIMLRIQGSAPRSFQAWYDRKSLLEMPPTPLSSGFLSSKGGGKERTESTSACPRLPKGSVGTSSSSASVRSSPLFLGTGTPAPSKGPSLLTIAT